MAAKVVIAGTGRAGTTLLVQILTDLGLDTGFGSDQEIDERVHAGLERGIEAPDAPRIVKNPNLSRRLGSLLDEGRVEIEHVIIPVRDLDIAAASRVRNTKYGADLHTFGGLIGTSKATRRREALALVFYELLYTVARYDLPHTFLMFPRFAAGLGVRLRQAVVPRPECRGRELEGRDRIASRPLTRTRDPTHALGAIQDARRHRVHPGDRAPRPRHTPRARRRFEVTSSP